MSLVGDALRRARAETGRRRGVAIPPGLGPPIRRSLFGGPAAIALSLVVVAAVAALVTWRLVGSDGDAPAAAAVAGRDHAAANDTKPAARQAMPEQADATSAVAPPTTLQPTDEQMAAATAAPGAAPPAASSPPPHTAEPEARTSQETDASVAVPQPPAAERSFVIDAELGYATLHLDYLVYKPSAPFARINGRDVIVGSIVQGFQVEEIGPDFVRLSDSRGDLTLRVR